MDRRRQRGLGLGVLLLAHKLFTENLGSLPPVTLLAIIGQSLLYMGIVNPPWGRYEVCLSGESILYHRDYRRLILSAIEHSNDIHLYHNMASFIFKGRSLENRYGSLKFLIILVVFTVATSMTYVGLAYVAAELLDTYSHMKSCAIGFSGVLFALKILTTYHEGNAYQYVHGVKFPAKYAVWAELVIIHILVPQASFIGHLAGILVGLAYVSGPISYIVDTIHQTIVQPRQTHNYGPGTGSRTRRSYTYAHGTAGGPSQQARPQYGWNTNQGYGPQDT